MARIEIHDIDFEAGDIAGLLRAYRGRAAQVLKELDAETLAVWQDCLTSRRVPGPDEFCGLHWSDAEARLEKTDPETRRWLMPFVRALAPRPMFVEPFKKRA